MLIGITVSLMTSIMSSKDLYAIGASSKVCSFTEVVYTPFIASLYSSRLIELLAFDLDIILPAPCGAE